MLKFMNESKEVMDNDRSLFYEVNLIEVAMTYMKLQRPDKVTKYLKELRERTEKKGVSETSYLLSYCDFIEMQTLGEDAIEKTQVLLQKSIEQLAKVDQKKGLEVGYLDLLFRSYMTQIMCAQGQFEEAKRFVEETEKKALKYYENVT